MNFLSSPSRTIAGLAVLTAIAIAVFPPLNSVPISHALSLTILTVGLWSSGGLPEHVTALVFFALAMLFGIAPANIIFSGFESTAFWLIFGGLAIGVAVTGSGLGARIARRLSRLFGTTYAGVIFGSVAIGVALSFLLPSAMGRVVLFLPIALTLADSLGFQPGSKGRTGIVLAAGFGSFLPAFGILPANVPNMVLIGVGEKLFGFTPIYGEWLFLHFPVLGLLKAFLIVLLILLFFPDHPQPRRGDPSHGKMSQAELGLSLVLALALIAWTSDFIHHISPAWISLAAGVICLLPWTGLIAAKDFGKINFASLFYVAGILGLGALVSQSGLGDRLATALIAITPLGPDQPLTNFLVLAATGIAIGTGTTLPGIPAVLTPLAGDLAKVTGLPIQSILMIQVLSFSTPLLPYQAPPLIVAMQLGGVRLKDSSKLLLLIAAVTILFLLPLDYLWWRLLGWI